MTAVAKLVSAMGAAPILDFPDPLFGVSTRHLLVYAALVETAVVGALLSRLQPRLKQLLVAWLSTNFLLYRAAVYILNPGKPCPCLGTLTEQLHLSQRASDILLSCVVFYLIVGSWTFLLGASPRPKPLAVSTQ